ncbi:hypothetical protein Agub_g2085, partial [Astrephomene gubernaculifera]
EEGGAGEAAAGAGDEDGQEGWQQLRQQKKQSRKQQQQQQQHEDSAWRETGAVPFAVRPVWDRTGSGSGGMGEDGAPMYGNNSAANRHALNHNHHPQQQHPGARQHLGSAFTSSGNNGSSTIGTSNHSNSTGVGGGSGSGAARRPVMTEEEFPSLLPSSGAGAGGGGGGCEGEKEEDPIVRALQLLKVPSPDILTPHLLLEGACLRHLYTAIFRGLPRLADAQLASVLSR